MDNLGFFLAAYAVIWAVVFGYLFFMQRKQRRLQREIGMLEESIRRRDADEDAVPANVLAENSD